MNDKQLIDIAWLTSQYRGNMEELLMIYITENDECMVRIDDAMKEDRHDDVRAVAHKMKGSSRIVGAFVIEELANSLEKTIDPSEVKSKVAELRDIYGKLKVEISHILK